MQVRRLALAIGLLAVLCPMWPAAQPEIAVFFGNLHSHTALSDGSGTPAEAYEHARDVAGLDFLAITEHNHAQAGDIAGNHALYTGPGSLSLIPTANGFTEDGRFVALYGQEFSTISSGNHMNVIDAPQVIDVPNGQVRTLLETWLPAHLDTQGQEPLLLLNHPSTSGSPRNLEYGIDDYGGDIAAWLAALDARAPLIDLINGPSHEIGTHLTPGKPSETEFHRYLNLGLHVAPTADQDNHKRNWGDATDARTAVLAPTLTKAALLTALKQRRAYATEDRNLRLVYRVNNQLMGSRIVGAAVPAAGTALTITLAITDDDEPTASYMVEVFSDDVGGEAIAGVVHTQSVTGNGTHTINGVTYLGGPQYVFLKVRQGDGNRAWTAPVWLEPAGIPPAPPDDEGAIAVSLAVDLQAETARITNTSTQPLALAGFKLVSVRGNQVFDQFPADLTLAAGESITVTSGATAQQGTGFLRWTNQNIWSNSGDPGQLIDPDGNVVARTGG
jgi:Lamin Tail Domain